MYEELIIFGSFGFTFLAIIIQATNILFINWNIIFFGQYLKLIIDSYGVITYLFIIPLYIFFCLFYCLLASINLQWFAIISSVKLFLNLFRLK